MKNYIVSDPDILNGTPVIRGTRIPVEKIKHLLEDGFNLEGIQKLYPHIKLSLIKEVMNELFKQLDSKKHKHNASIS